MTRRLIFAAAALAALLVCHAPLGAETLTVAMEDYPPYQHQEDGKVIGMDAEAVREAFARMGANAQFKVMPWKRALDEAATGRVDAIFSLFRTPEREEFLAYPETPLSSERNVLVARADDPATVTGLGDIKGERVGVVVGFVYGEPFDSYAGVIKDSSYDADMLLRKLDKGRVRFAAMAQPTFLELAKDEEFTDRFRIVEGFRISEEGMYLAFSRATGEERAALLAQRFNQALAAMKAEGLLAAIQARYGFY